MPVFDATMLLYFLDPDAQAPEDPKTKEPLIDAKERVDFLVQTLQSKRETIIIPTLALSEALIRADHTGPQ